MLAGAADGPDPMTTAPSQDPEAGDVTVVAHELRETGGMERAQARIVMRLLERGWRVHVVARVCELPPHPHMRWTQVRTPGRPFMLAFPLFAAWASLVLVRQRGGVTTTLGAIILPRVDVCTVQFCHHGFHERGSVTRRRAPGRIHRINQWLAGRLALWMERWCYSRRRVRRLVAVSETIGRELQDAFPAHAEAVSVIPNGVDPQRFRPDPVARQRTREMLGLPAAAKVAAFVGGDWERKGLAIAIEAIGRLPDWRLLVVGQGDVQTYEQVARTMGATGRVTFAGQQADTAPFFAAADAFVLPTQYEGFALVTLEAAATGLPLLVTIAAGADGLALDGVTGWTLDRDAVAFANHLAALGDEEQAAQMGQAARERAAGYSWEEIGDAHAGIYAQVRRERDAVRS